LFSHYGPKTDTDHWQILHLDSPGAHGRSLLLSNCLVVAPVVVVVVVTTARENVLRPVFVCLLAE